MKKLICLLACVVTSSAALAGSQREGTAPETFAATNPPAPSEVKVAVLPFWAANQRQIEIARGAILLNLQRHRFGIVPATASLVVCAQETDRVVKADAQREPGARIQREDAVRLGRQLNARWVIYGEVEKLECDISHRAAIDLRLVILDVASEKILYWVRWQDTGSRSGSAKRSSNERRIAVQTINLTFDELKGALPPHKMGPEVTEEQVRQFIQAMGQ